MRVALVVLSLLSLACPASAQRSPPATIDITTLGPPTFIDRFHTLDAGPDETIDATPLHRWRTITKACDPVFTIFTTIMHDCREAGAEGVYVDSSLGMSPFSISAGQLTIHASKLSATQARRWRRGYSSGWLSTKFSFQQRYGYFEMRAKLPVGPGLWPAFWLMPSTGIWPGNGEIDVMESLGVDGIYYASLHAKPWGRELHETLPITRPGTTLTGAFHNYGVAWTPQELVFYFDRKEVGRRRTPADMHQPMYMILNLATGGSWPGAMTVPAGQFVIDRVSAWKLP